MTRPRISVVLPFHNGGSFIRPAVESVLGQSLPDFELLLIDDGSSDGSEVYCAQLRDRRVRYVKNQGSGLVDALNTGLECANGELIARMDADDICMPNRFRDQVEYLEENIACSVLATDVILIDEKGRSRGARGGDLPTGECLVLALSGQVRIDPIVHPSIMMRREVFRQVGGYRQFRYAEDRDLWLRASRQFEFSRLKVPLLKYRVHRHSVSREKVGDQLISGALAVANERVFRRTGVDVFKDRPTAWAEIVFEAEQFRQNKIYEAYVRKSLLSTLKYERQLARFSLVLLQSALKYRQDISAHRFREFVRGITETIEKSMLRRI